MPDLRSVKLTMWRKFLETVGCKYYQMKGDHELWGRSDLYRPIVFPVKHKELTQSLIRSNLRTLNMSAEDYQKILEKL
jgi:predicted RNA binding protein YcfA (HicA-like mRNA interferase family)